jgi:hypothetical protein
MCETPGLPLHRHPVGEIGAGAGMHGMATIPNLTDGFFERDGQNVNFPTPVGHR